MAGSSWTIKRPVAPLIYVHHKKLCCNCAFLVKVVCVKSMAFDVTAGHGLGVTFVKCEILTSYMLLIVQWVAAA